MYQALVDFQYWTFIAQICNLLLQAFLFKKFLFKPVKAIFEKRQQEVEGLYASAEDSQKVADENKMEYEGKLASAQAEADEIIREATTQAHHRSDEILADANKQVLALREKADKDIEQEKKKAVNDIKDEVSDMAIDIACKIAEKEIRKEDHEKLINDFIDRLGEEA